MFLAMAFTMMPIMGTPVYADDPAPAAIYLANGAAPNIKGGQKHSIYFGNYPQSEYTPIEIPTDPVEGKIYTDTDGTKFICAGTINYNVYAYFRIQPIKWRVLEVDGNKVLLLSDKVLEWRAYNYRHERIFWENCTLRSWFNGLDSSANKEGKDYTNNNFLSTAFKDVEKNAVLTTTVKKIEVGNDTQDKVFLLSLNDLTNEAYGFDAVFDSLPAPTRAAKVTGYAATKHHNWVDGSEGGWWYRSEGDSTYASYVYGGEVAGGLDTILGIEGNMGIRPALYLDLSSGVWDYAGTISSNGTVDEIVKPHDWGKWSADKNGITHSRICKNNCSTVQEAKHNFGSWTVIKDSTEKN